MNIKVKGEMMFPYSVGVTWDDDLDRPLGNSKWDWSLWSTGKKMNGNVMEEFTEEIKTGEIIKVIVDR